MYITIYILTVLDCILTAIGIKNGWVEEANPILEVMNRYPVEVGILVSLFVGLMLIWIYRHRRPWFVYPLIVVLITKVGIIILHFDWIIQIISRGGIWRLMYNRDRD